MIYIIYILPLSGSQDGSQLVCDRTRVGNLFNTGRQKLIVARSTTDGESTITVMSGLSDFDAIDDSANENMKISTTSAAPLRIPTQSSGDNSTKAASTAYVDSLLTSTGFFQRIESMISFRV